MKKRSFNWLRSALLGATALGMVAVSGTANAQLVGEGDALPDFSVTALNGAKFSNGILSNVDVADLGILYFFSDSCKSCKDGLAEVSKLSMTPDSRAITLAIAKGDKAAIKSYVDPLGLKYPVALADEATIKAFGATYFPMVFVSGPDGRILKTLAGSTASRNGVITALAEKQLQRGKFDDAKRLFAMVEGDNLVEKAIYGLGYSALKSGEIDEAEKHFAKLADNANGKISAKGAAGLARVYLKKGKTEKAMSYATQSLAKDPQNVAANTIKGKLLFKDGDKAGAAQALKLAAAEDADFSFEKAEALVTKGNLERENKNVDISLVSYDEAIDADPFSVEALSNKGVTLQEMGKPEKALDILKKAAKTMPGDRMVSSLMRKAQEAIDQKMDMDKQEHVRKQVADLVKRFKEQQDAPAETKDDWTTGAPAVWVMDFEDSREADLDHRAGDSQAFIDELIYTLQDNGIPVVERDMIDKILAELQLGSSDLADSDMQSRLGKLISATAILKGRLRDRDVRPSSIAVETSRRMRVKRQKLADMDLIDAAIEMGDSYAKMLWDKHPVKARILAWDGEQATLNIGANGSLAEDMVFEVLEEGKKVMDRGVERARLKPVGKIRVVDVQDQLAFAEIEGDGFSKKNYKVRLVSLD